MMFIVRDWVSNEPRWQGLPNRPEHDIRWRAKKLPTYLSYGALLRSLEAYRYILPVLARNRCGGFCATRWPHRGRGPL